MRGPLPIKAKEWRPIRKVNLKTVEPTPEDEKVAKCITDECASTKSVKNLFYQDDYESCFFNDAGVMAAFNVKAIVLDQKIQDYAKAHGVSLEDAKAMVCTGESVRSRASIKKSGAAEKKKKGRDAKEVASEAQEPARKKCKDKGKASAPGTTPKPSGGRDRPIPLGIPRGSGPNPPRGSEPSSTPKGWGPQGEMAPVTLRAFVDDQLAIRHHYERTQGPYLDGADPPEHMSWGYYAATHMYRTSMALRLQRAETTRERGDFKRLQEKHAQCSEREEE